MRWLTNLLRRPRGHRERGSVSLIVAVLFGTGVMLGCAALAVDVGSISAERRQLQNGSDAAALSAAMDCVRDGSCPSAGDTELNSLADKNAEDDASRIARVDGGVPICGQGPDLSPCPAVSGLLGDCVAPSSGTMPANYVRVYTQTEAQDGSTILPYFFGQAIVGGTGTTQQTCATAAWGTPGKITPTIPFTIGACEFSQATGYNPPTTEGTYPSEDMAIALNYKKGAECESWNGHDFPGGFGWLSNVNCETTVKSGDWVSVEPGMGNAGDCSTLIDAAMGNVVYLPVYDCISNNETFCDNAGSGSNAEYHLLGLAAFKLEGFYAPSYHGDTGSDLGIPCPGKAGACIWGHFVKAIVPVGSIDDSGGSPDLGLNVIQMVG